MAKWMVAAKKADFNKIANDYGITPVLARIIRNRDLTEDEDIRKFLKGNLQDLHSPFLLKDMDKATDLILDKINNQSAIRVIGDYDVDGIMATFLLYKVLHVLGATVDYRIPDRIADGYGMNMRMIEEAERDHIALLLTCDNGIAAMEPIKRAKTSGIKVVVTDHHEIPNYAEGDRVCYDLPPADVIVNPKQPGETYPQPGICGAMVAYKVISLLLAEAEDLLPKKEAEELLSELTIPVALATVCDVMELTGENRIVVAQGLGRVANCRNCGIRALIKAYELEDKTLTAYHAGFLIGPCFNAAGRLDTALQGLELLLCDNAEEAMARAMKLKELNDTRKEMTAEAVREATALAREKLAGGALQVLVIYLQSCHESLAGIVAGRLRETFYLPTIVLTKGENCVKGSGRSIEGYSMYEKLSEQKELFLAFGGHPMAAGVSLEEKNVHILEERLNQAAGLTEEDLTPKLYLDAVLPFSGISDRLMDELDYLEPFGNGNTKPVFAQSAVKVWGMRRIGKDGTSLRLQLTDAAGTSLTGLYFHGADEFEQYLTEEFGEDTVRQLYRERASVQMTIAFAPSINEYQGIKSPQVIVQAYKRYVIS